MSWSRARTELAERGYVVVPGVVPPALCRGVVGAIADFLSIDPDDPASWRETSEPINGIVPIHQHPALWAVRQHPPVHAVFAELLGTEALWVTMDRCGFKPPRPSAPDRPNRIHLDKGSHDLTGPIVQGLVYLTDTPAHQGAFECVPSLYREMRAGSTVLGAGPVSVDDREVVPVGGPAGSLLVWSTMLPHGSGHNRGARPRFTQYVSMFAEGDGDARRERVELWRASRAPSWWRDEIEGQVDPEPWPPAELTELGERLLGLTRWAPRA